VRLLGNGFEKVHAWTIAIVMTLRLVMDTNADVKKVMMETFIIPMVI